MAVWALADLHLSFGVKDKSMDVFGERWKNHAARIRENWLQSISQDDLVLLPGDISWAMHIEDVVPDLNWIHELPGTKVLLRGNHDYWWSSLSKIEKVLPPSMHLIQNNAFLWKDVAVCGARLWDSPEYSFQPYIEYIDNPRAKTLVHEDAPGEAEKIFLRELSRLELSLKALPKEAKHRLAMTHYPPIGAELQPSRASVLLEKYHIHVCVFGHLHNIKENSLPFGTKNNVRYTLVSGDYLNFTPVKLLD